VTPEPLEEENERLRARVAELERQLGEQAAAANAAIAAAQDRAYWLDRARIDPDALLASPAGRALRAAARAVRVLRRRR
jgi:cell division septum initiation protein DivIVA